MEINPPDRRHIHPDYDIPPLPNHERQPPFGGICFDVHVWPSSNKRTASLSELVALIRSLRDERDVGQSVSVVIIQPDETLRTHAKAVIDVMSVSFEVRYLRHISDMDHDNPLYHHADTEKVFLIIDQTSIDARMRELDSSSAA